MCKKCECGCRCREASLSLEWTTRTTEAVLSRSSDEQRIISPYQITAAFWAFENEKLGEP